MIVKMQSIVRYSNNSAVDAKHARFVISPWMLCMN